jgi:hypothetical protein
MSTRRAMRCCCGIAAILIGCGDDEPTTTVRGTGRPLAAAPKPAAPPAPSAVAAPAGAPTPPGAPPGAARPDDPLQTELGPFTYKPGRDPFQSYFDVTTEAPVTTKLEPLQKHDLAKLKIVAIATGTVQPAAIVLDPQGKTHLVRRGTLIGPPRGRVAQILTDRVVVEREFKDRQERVHKLRHQMRIRPDLEPEKGEGSEEAGP